MASNLFGPGKPDANHSAQAERDRQAANKRENQRAAGQAAGRGKRRI